MNMFKKLSRAKSSHFDRTRLSVEDSVYAKKRTIFLAGTACSPITGQAKSRGWVGRGWVFRGSWVVGRGWWVVGRGSWVVGRGSCLLEDKNIYISSLSARSKFAIARSRINFPELLSFMKR